MSNVTTLLSFNISGTSPDITFCANPSTIAVFPTPVSPTRHGLFFVLLDNICITLSISSFIPITGSTFPSSTFLVKSSPNWFNVCVEL